MTRSELLNQMSQNRLQVSRKIIDRSLKEILEQITTALINFQRIEIRGFGSFSLHYRSRRMGRNPKTGKKIILSEKYTPYFKPGKKLRYQINQHT